MRNTFLKPALIFTIFLGLTIFFFSDVIYLSFKDAEDLYAENFDIIEHGEGGRIETEIYASLGSFGYETTTTTSRRGGSTSSTDYYYAIPVYDKNGEEYYIAIEVYETNRSTFEKITNNSYDYELFGSKVSDFEGTICELDDDLYEYMLESFRGWDDFENETDLRNHVLPLCLETRDFDSAPVFMVIIGVLFVLTVLFWILFFKRRSKMKAHSNTYTANAMAAGGMAMSGATLNGVPINNVPQQNNDPYSAAYNTQYNNTSYGNTQYNNTQYNAPQASMPYDSIVINGVPYSRAALAQVNSYVLTGESIKAIKEFRELSGLGLAEAKNVIDNWSQYYK